VLWGVGGGVESRHENKVCGSMTDIHRRGGEGGEKKKCQGWGDISVGKIEREVRGGRDRNEGVGWGGEGGGNYSWGTVGVVGGGGGEIVRGVEEERRKNKGGGGADQRLGGGSDGRGEVVGGGGKKKWEKKQREGRERGDRGGGGWGGGKGGGSEVVGGGVAGGEKRKGVGANCL